MSGMKYPKAKHKKKRKQHQESILHQKDGTCYLCLKLHDDARIWPVLHKHHIFGGPDRQLSEAYGLTVYLHPGHHEYGPEAVHGNDKEIADMLHKDGQQAFETNHTREEFMALFRKNYL